MTDNVVAERDRREAKGAVAWVGAGLSLLAGMVGLALAPGHFYEDAHSLGSLFLVGSLAAAVAAFGIFRGRRWGWALGVATSAAAVMAVCAELRGVFPGL